MAKKIGTPEILLSHFDDYRKWAKSNPFKVKDWVGKDAREVTREKERPLTLEGFENYCAENNIIRDLKDYFSNKDGRYADYVHACRVIKNTIRADQIEGGMCGIYNPNITQRLNGLVEKTSIEGSAEQPLFPDKITEIIITRAKEDRSQKRD